MLNKLINKFPLQPDGSRRIVEFKSQRLMTEAEVTNVPPDLSVRYFGPIKTETKRVVGGPVLFETDMGKTAFFPTITISTRVSYVPPELRPTE